MRQFFIQDDYNAESTVIISGKDFHYLKDVLRLKNGDTFDGINKSGNTFKLIILKEKDNSLILGSQIKTKTGEKRKIKLNLYQCLPKAKKMDLIVRQATETGISRIIPIISSNTIVKLQVKLHAKSKEKINIKLKRWKRIIKEAIQQSGTTTYPELEDPVPIETLYKANTCLNLVFHQEPLSENTLFSYLQIGLKQVNLTDINILIGPEGGFTNKEITELITYGFRSVYLGKEVLRVETAALYAIASIKILLLELMNQEKRH